MAALPKIDISWLNESPEKKRCRRSKEPGPKRPPGRPAVKDEFPSVVDVAREFIRSNGFKAHRRRQEEIGTCGSSLDSIRDHLLQTVPGLALAHPKLSTRTVAHWMQAPNKSFNASKSYKGYIDARVPHKDNSSRKFNDNNHFYSARVRYTMELASQFGEYVRVFSADNKNKVKVGNHTLAVDRRIAINRFFPTDDRPVYFDHDFPTPGYLLTPSGYLELEPATGTTKDQLGREHFVWPKSSQATVFIRSPHSIMNIAAHMNDLHVILSEPLPAPSSKSVLVLVIDGGPDFNVNHSVNEFYYARFFRDQNLDALLVTSYCPGYSALNPVEHLWAPCTRALTSCYLPSTLPGEDKPPCSQTGLSEEERRLKGDMVFDAAMALLKDRYWSDVSFAQRRVDVRCEKSGAPPNPYGRDYDRVKDVLGGSLKKLKDNPDINQDYLFAARHMDRRIGMILFSKCSDCAHCLRHPPTCSSDLMSAIRNFPSPSPGQEEGHFNTYCESSEQPFCPPCEHLPLFHSKGFGRCDRDGCKYVFTSKKDVTDHRRKAH